MPGESKPKVIIVGAGLSGLACAITLKRRGIKSLILESSDQVGGRVRTDHLASGFTLDHGFQVLLSTYPEVSKFIDLSLLKLQQFNSGALIQRKNNSVLLANPVAHPQDLVSTMLSGVATFKDQLLTGKLLVQVFARNAQPLYLGVTTLEYLKKFGFSVNFIESFWRPFFSGVFLDKTLSVDAAFFLFLLKHFAKGAVSVPENGMAEIPQTMLSELGKSNVRLNTEVSEINATDVRLSSGETLSADFVVRAFNKDVLQMHSATTYYFCCHENPGWGKWLLLVPSELNMKINQVAVMNEVAQSYSPRGQFLLSATVVGSSADIAPEQIAQELKQLSRKELKLTHLKTYAIKAALPRYSQDSTGYKLTNGIYECGDHLSSPSIDGALKSGRLVGEAIASI